MIYDRILCDTQKGSRVVWLHAGRDRATGTNNPCPLAPSHTHVATSVTHVTPPTPSTNTPHPSPA